MVDQRIDGRQRRGRSDRAGRRNQGAPRGAPVPVAPVLDAAAPVAPVLAVPPPAAGTERAAPPVPETPDPLAGASLAPLEGASQRRPGTFRVNPPPSTELSYDLTITSADGEQTGAGTSSLSWQLKEGRYALRLASQYGAGAARDHARSVSSDGGMDDMGIAPERARSATARKRRRSASTVRPGWCAAPTRSAATRSSTVRRTRPRC